MPLNWPKSANVLLHWKSAPHYVAREAKRGEKAILARKAHRDRRDQKEKEATLVARATRVHKGYRGRQEREATLVARAYPVLKVPRDLQGQRAKKAIPALRARQGFKVREAYPVLKAPRDPQGQRAIPADLTRLQQLEVRISELEKQLASSSQ